MLDTIKINTNRIQIVKPIQVQDIYGTIYSVSMFGYPKMELKEKRFIKQAPFIEKTGKYYPSVTFRGNGKVYIEFSASKILFDNNVQELSNDDSEAFIKALEAKLFDMGISIQKEELWKAQVSFATVSKNIIIDEVGATEFIEFTRRLWWKWRKSIKFENYKEDGVSIRKYTSTTGIGIYAKVPSLQSIKTKTEKELELVDKLKTNSILRFEYRMQSYQRTLSKYSWAKGYKLDKLTLRDIYDENLSKKILLYDLGKSLFSSEFNYLSMKLPNIKRIYEFIMDKGLKPSEEFTVIAAFRLASDLGVKRAKDTFDSRYSGSTSKRAWKLVEEIFCTYTDYEYSDIKNSIEARIKDYKAITESDISRITELPSNMEQMSLI